MRIRIRPQPRWGWWFCSSKPKVALADSGNLGLEDTTPLGLQGNLGLEGTTPLGLQGSVPARMLAGKRGGGGVR